MKLIKILLLITLLIAPAQGADDAQPQAAHNEATLDDLLKLSDEKKPEDKGKPALPPVEPTQTTGNESVDVLLKAISEMEQVSQRLRIRQDPGLDTQRLQESILRRLDDAIASAQKQKQQQQQQNQPGSSQQKQETGSPQNQQKPGQQKEQQPGDKQQQAGENPGENAKPETVDAQNPGGPIEETRIEWGRLPARIRGELDQGLGEKFSPIYKKLTEAYYRRLAEEGKE